MELSCDLLSLWDLRVRLSLMWILIHVIKVTGSLWVSLICLPPFFVGGKSLRDLRLPQEVLEFKLLCVNKIVASRIGTS